MLRTTGQLFRRCFLGTVIKVKLKPREQVHRLITSHPTAFFTNNNLRYLENNSTSHKHTLLSSENAHAQFSERRLRTLRRSRQSKERHEQTLPLRAIDWPVAAVGPSSGLARERDARRACRLTARAYPLPLARTAIDVASSLVRTL